MVQFKIHPTSLEYQLQVLFHSLATHLGGRGDNLHMTRVPVTSINLYFYPLNPELNPICLLLALLGAHHILHVSRIRVKHFYAANTNEYTEK